MHRQIVRSRAMCYSFGARTLSATAPEDAMSGPRKAEIRKQTRLFDDFFKIDEVIVSHQRRDGTMSPDERRLVFERGDAVAVILYNTDNKTVIVVDQFKVPSLIGRRRDNPHTMDGWVTEATAGMIDPGETAEAAIKRETMEETGYSIGNPRLICKFFSSPGGTSERIFLYFAEVHESNRTGKGGGLPGEDITVVGMPVDQLFKRLAYGEIDDPKLAIGAYWLKGQLDADPSFIQSLQTIVKDLSIGYHAPSAGRGARRRSHASPANAAASRPSALAMSTVCYATEGSAGNRRRLQDRPHRRHEGSQHLGQFREHRHADGPYHRPQLSPPVFACWAPTEMKRETFLKIPSRKACVLRSAHMVMSGSGPFWSPSPAAWPPRIRSSASCT